jgi:hypothetical protein
LSSDKESFSKLLKIPGETGPHPRARSISGVRPPLFKDDYNVLDITQAGGICRACSQHRKYEQNIMWQADVMVFSVTDVTRFGIIE